MAGMSSSPQRSAYLMDGSYRPELRHPRAASCHREPLARNKDTLPRTRGRDKQMPSTRGTALATPELNMLGMQCFLSLACVGAWIFVAHNDGCSDTRASMR